MLTRLLPLLALMIFSTLCLAQVEHQYFTTEDGIKIAYTDEGKGTTVILLHGFISDGDNWREAALKPMLIDNEYRVINPDLRGNGQSDKPQEAKYYKDNIEVHDIMSLLSHLDIDKYCAIGYYKGSIVLAKLLMMDSRITMSSLGGMGADFIDPKWDRRLMFAATFSGDPNAHPDTKGAVTYAKSIGANIVAIGHQQTYQPVTSLTELKKVRIPILVIEGAEDRDNGAPSDLANLLQFSQLSVVPGNHNNTYKTESFAQAILSYIENEH